MSLLKEIIRKNLLASNITVKLFSPNIFQKIKIPMEHRAPHEDYGDDLKWKDIEYNYRLDDPVDEIYYAFTKNEVIGHLGLDENEKIIAVYVSPNYRRKGVSTKMHEEVFSRNTSVFSDDSNAMEPDEKATWEKLMKKMPNYIEKLKDGSYVYQS